MREKIETIEMVQIIFQSCLSRNYDYCEQCTGTLLETENNFIVGVAQFPIFEWQWKTVCLTFGEIAGRIAEQRCNVDENKASDVSPNYLIPTNTLNN